MELWQIQIWDLNIQMAIILISLRSPIDSLYKRSGNPPHYLQLIYHPPQGNLYNCHLNEGLISQKEGFGGRTGVYETWKIDL